MTAPHSFSSFLYLFIRVTVTFFYSVIYYFELFWIFQETLTFLIADCASREAKTNVYYDCRPSWDRMNLSRYFYVFLYYECGSFISLVVYYLLIFFVFMYGKMKIVQSTRLRKTVHTSDLQSSFVF